MRVTLGAAFVAATFLTAGAANASTILIDPTTNNGSFEEDLGAPGLNNANNTQTPGFTFTNVTSISFFSFDRNDSPQAGNPNGVPTDGLRTLVANGGSGSGEFTLASDDIALAGPLTAGSTFDFSFDFGQDDVDETTDALTATLNFDNGSSLELVNLANFAVADENAFQSLGGTGIAISPSNIGATSVSLTIAADLGAGVTGGTQVFLDNIVLSADIATEIPEPTAIALAMIGLVGAAARRRRS